MQESRWRWQREEVRKRVIRAPKTSIHWAGGIDASMLANLQDDFRRPRQQTQIYTYETRASRRWQCCATDILLLGGIMLGIHICRCWNIGGSCGAQETSRTQWPAAGPVTSCRFELEHRWSSGMRRWQCRWHTQRFGQTLRGCSLLSSRLCCQTNRTGETHDKITCVRWLLLSLWRARNAGEIAVALLISVAGEIMQVRWRRVSAELRAARLQRRLAGQPLSLQQRSEQRLSGALWVLTLAWWCLMPNIVPERARSRQQRRWRRSRHLRRQGQMGWRSECTWILGLHVISCWTVFTNVTTEHNDAPNDFVSRKGERFRDMENKTIRFTTREGICRSIKFRCANAVRILISKWKTV